MHGGLRGGRFNALFMHCDLFPSMSESPTCDAFVSVLWHEASNHGSMEGVALFGHCLARSGPNAAAHVLDAVWLKMLHPFVVDSVRDCMGNLTEHIQLWFSVLHTFPRHHGIESHACSTRDGGPWRTQISLRALVTI